MNISSDKSNLKNTYIAISTMLLAILCVDLYMVVIKFLGNDYSVIQLAVFRNIAGVIPLFLLIIFTKEFVSVFKNLNNRFLILTVLTLLTVQWINQWKNIRFTFTEANLLPDKHEENIRYKDFLEIFGEDPVWTLIAGQPA